MTTPRPACRALSVTMINADGSTDLFTPALHLEQMTTDRDYWQKLAGQRREQVRTLEADLVMCREQLAQETERAEKAEKMATSPGSPLVQQADTYRRILAHSAIYTHTCISPGRGSMSDQIIARLDELAAAESERDEWRDRALQSTDYEQQHGAQLPIPDATNPAHLAFIDAGIEALVQDWADGSQPQAVGRVQQAIRAEGARLEAAQQQADAEKSLIEKAAKVIAFAAERNDLGVTESEMWETYLASESRCKYLDYARALHAANLLRDGDHKAADGGLAPEGGISNGQLLAMDSDRRAERIASLSLEVRRKLANIACLGASRLISQAIADKYNWRANRMAEARDFTDLAANLLRDGGEK